MYIYIGVSAIISGNLADVVNRHICGLLERKKRGEGGREGLNNGFAFVLHRQIVISIKDDAKDPCNLSGVQCVNAINTINRAS